MKIQLTTFLIPLVALMSGINREPCALAQRGAASVDSLNSSSETGDSLGAAIDSTGALGKHRPADVRAATADNYQLYQNYPNPFNPTTEIGLFIGQPAKVNLSIYNLLGQRVKVLIDDELTAGIHSLQWDGRDAFGHLVPGGIYFYRMQTESWATTRKMMFIE